MDQDDTLDIDRSQLMYEYQKFDYESDIIQCLSNELKKHGRYISAEYVDEAKQYLMQAIFSIKNGLKTIETVANCEQLVMDLQDL